MYKLKHELKIHRHILYDCEDSASQGVAHAGFY